MVAPAVKALEGSGIPVASVATGFPAGLTPLEAAARGDPLCGRRGRARDRHRHHPRPCARPRLAARSMTRSRRCAKPAGARILKAILGTGDLKTLRNVYAASMVAMLAGADFIKTSTGKEDVNATLAGEPGHDPGDPRLSRARGRRHRLQAGGRLAHRQGRARLAHPDEGRARPAVDAARPLPHRRERPS